MEKTQSNTCEYFKASEGEGREGAQYRIIKKIGRGTFSTVYLCEDVATGCQYAMKVHQEQEGINDSKRAIIMNDA